MSQEQVMGIVRHSLTILAGVLVSKGITDEGTATVIVGGLVGIFGIIWSAYSNKKSEIVKKSKAIQKSQGVGGSNGN